MACGGRRPNGCGSLGSLLCLRFFQTCAPAAGYLAADASGGDLRPLPCSRSGNVCRNAGKGVFYRLRRLIGVCRTASAQTLSIVQKQRKGAVRTSTAPPKYSGNAKFPGRRSKQSTYKETIAANSNKIGPLTASPPPGSPAAKQCPYNSVCAGGTKSRFFGTDFLLQIFGASQFCCGCSKTKASSHFLR